MNFSAKQAIVRTIHAFRPGVVLPLTMTAFLYRGTDKGAHGYLEHYRRHLAPLRYKRNRVLEIGVGGWSDAEHYSSTRVGGSLRLWRDYLPRSVILGFDIENKHVDLGQRVQLIQGDQSSLTDLDKIIPVLRGAPNIVIDDGSHIAPHARITFEHLFPQMPTGSLYVIEDLHTSYWEAFGGATDPAPPTAIGLVKELVDAVQARDSAHTVAGSDGHLPSTSRTDVAAVHVYPGIAFIIKA